MIQKKNLDLFLSFLKNNYFLFISYSIILISLFILILSSVMHPLIGDDYLFQNTVTNSAGLLEYLYNQYYLVSGRFIQALLSYFIFKFDIILLFIKIINIPIFVVIVWLGWYCATNKFPTYKDKDFWKFIVFLLIIWLSINSVSENIIWLTGSFTWLYSLFFAMVFFSFFFHSYYGQQNQNNNFQLNFLKSLFLIFIGFIAGSSIEQISAICFIISICIIINLKLNHKPVPIYLYIAFIALIIGALYLFFAPGNYARISKYPDKNFLVMIFQYLLYLSSAYFSLGEDTAGKSFFISLFALFFLFNPNLKFDLNNFKISTYFLLGSFFSLLIMFPVVYAVSTRTTFFAIFFLYLFFLRLNYFNQVEFLENELKLLFKKNLFIFILSCLLFVDSTIGLITNIEYNIQNNHRNTLIESALDRNQKKVEIPFFSVIPSRLTHILSPLHDSEFLKDQSFRKQIIIVHQNDPNSKLPYSKNILKNVKNILY